MREIVTNLLHILVVLVKLYGAQDNESMPLIQDEESKSRLVQILTPEEKDVLSLPR